MGALLGRLVLLVNNTNHVVELKESRRFAPPGIYSYTIQLYPFDDKEILATKFHQRAMDASRPTVIQIFLNGVYSNKVLTPQDFIDYRIITFWVDENGELMVRGVRAARLIEQICRIRVVRFLKGNDDHGDGGMGEDIT